MHRPAALGLSLIASLSLGCSESSPVQPTAPAAGEPSRAASAAQPLASVGGWTFNGPEPGCQTADLGVTWVFTASSIPETVRLYPHAFRDDQASCNPTTKALATMNISGPVEYLAGSSGETTFSYPPNEVRCGRVSLGVILKDVLGRDSMLSWRVVNSGRDCAPVPPPAPAPAPAPPKKCTGRCK
jgi:hypothetical protein